MAADWTDPEERCPACGAHLLIERFRDTIPHAPVRYCSFVECDWSDHPERLSPTCCQEDDRPPLIAALDAAVERARQDRAITITDAGEDNRG